MINQTLASPIANGMARLYLRVGGPQPKILPVIGPEAGSASALPTIGTCGRGSRAASAIGSPCGCIRA